MYTMMVVFCWLKECKHTPLSIGIAHIIMKWCALELLQPSVLCIVNVTMRGVHDSIMTAEMISPH